MKGIGNIIKEYRRMLGVSRKALSENICSEKYIYLIEKGERTPSSDLTRLIGDRLGVDLFEYYEFLDCINPIEVNETIKCFNRFRRENDLISLKKITNYAMSLPDFYNKPRLYEIEINRIFYMALKEGRSSEAIRESCDLIKQIEPKYAKEVFVADLYALLSMCYQMDQDLDNARSAILSAYDIICNKQRITKYAQTVISIKINKITIHYLSGEYDATIEEALMLWQYQIDMSAYERFHHTFFYLAFAHYKKGMEEESISWFIKGISASLIRYKATDIYYLSQYDVFGLLIDDSRVPHELVSEFKKSYRIS